MEIRILGAHDCEAQDIKPVTLLIDDTLAIDAGALTSSLTLAAQFELDAILLTHQHYDHIRDIPAIAMNALLHETTINVYSIQKVYDALSNYLLNDQIYPDFFNRPEGKPTINFTLMPPYESQQVAGYDLLTIPVNHSVAAVGYQITSPDGKTLFYTGDTGPDLADCWRQISPHLIIIELTAPNRYEQFCRDKGHLTPSLLANELECFRKLKGYLPPVVTVHMNPGQEKEIAAEVAALTDSSDYPIRLAQENMLIKL